FVEAARARFPGLDVRRAFAEELPFPDGSFDVALAQLVVHFMDDAVAGLREMGRVAGTVAACVWDMSPGEGPLGVFWRAVQDIDPSAVNESDLPGTQAGQLVALCEAAGLQEVTGSVLVARVEHPTFDEWWEPYTMGVGPSGAFLAALDEGARSRIRERCREL